MITECQKCKRARAVLIDWAVVIVLGVLIGWGATNYLVRV